VCALCAGPIVLLNAVSLRDHAPAIYVFSQWLAIGHGLAHVFYPFLDEHSGVVKSVDVWQDQLLHLGQAALFGLIFFSRSGRTFKVAALLFVLANVVNVILGYLCWGQECHDMYVWVSLAPALASGLHHATGALYMTEFEVCPYFRAPTTARPSTPSPEPPADIAALVEMWRGMTWRG
jgi:hypothetical protein